MSWTLAHATDWSTIANAAAGAVGSTLADGWTTTAASTFSVAGGKLNVAWAGGATYYTSFLARPASERASDQRIVVDVPPAFCDNGYCSPAIRYQPSTGASYFVVFDGTTVTAYGSSGSDVSSVFSGSISPGYDPTHAYRVDLAAIGTSPTTIAVVVTDTTAGAIVYSGSGTSNFGPQAAGDCAMTAFGTIRVSAISTYAASVAPIGYKLVGVGDSLTYGATASSGGGTAGGTTMLAGALATLGAGWSGVNLGVSGKTATAMIADAPAQAAAQFDPTKIACVAPIEAGINDFYNLGNGGVTAATVYARLVTLHGLWRAAGHKTIATTLTPASPTALVWPADYEAQRLALNATIRANWSTFADGIADLASDADMGQAGEEASTTYFAGDRLHYSDAGYARWASYVAGASRVAAGLAPLSPSIVRVGSVYLVDGARYVGTYAPKFIILQTS